MSGCGTPSERDRKVIKAFAAQLHTLDLPCPDCGAEPGRWCNPSDRFCAGRIRVMYARRELL